MPAAHDAHRLQRDACRPAGVYFLSMRQRAKGFFWSKGFFLPVGEK
jgi:hypothetical protein